MKRVFLVTETYGARKSLRSNRIFKNVVIDLTREELSPNGKWMTREQVEKVIGSHINPTQGLLWALDELFGEKSE